MKVLASGCVCGQVADMPSCNVVDGNMSGWDTAATVKV